MPYSNKEYETMNVNYLNKDFNTLKSNLVEYAKTYFPNSYKDFNETSPGMMLIEMSAYVGDVLSFYIDQQYKEMLLPLAQERRNVVNMAKMMGYKAKSSSPAFVNLTVKQTIGTTTGDIDNIQPLMSDAQVIAKGMKIQSSTNSKVFFETLDVVDFTISGSEDVEGQDNSLEVFSTDTNGMVTGYTLTKQVKAISGEIKSTTSTIGSPQKFKRITLPDLDVIEIIDVYDSSNNRWYEVEYLAQSRIPRETHWSEDNRTSAYYSIADGTEETIPVPYTLDYINVSKRFVVDVDSNNVTSLTFGNGLLNTPTTGSLVQGFLQSEQAGITIPGDETNFDTQISPLISANSNASLGEIPQNTTLTIRYRAGGGIKANVPTGDLTVLDSITRIVEGNGSTPTIRNDEAARGGGSGESIIEIKQNTQANFLSQRRCVTREDYQSRILSMPAKFGNIAKISVRRGGGLGGEVSGQSNLTQTFSSINEHMNLLYSNLDSINAEFDEILNPVGAGYAEPTTTTHGADWWNNEFVPFITLVNTNIGTQQAYGSVYSTMDEINSLVTQGQLQVGELTSATHGAIEIYILSYNNGKNLSYSPTLLHNNLNNYLLEYRMITDEFTINNGYIINFGVGFEVVSSKQSNKHEVKLRCINAIANYFNIDNMKMRQPIYTNDVIYLLMGIEGVRSVNYVELTQDNLSNAVGGNSLFSTPLWDYNMDNPHTAHGASSNNAVNSGAYGYEYNFNQFYDGTLASDGIILPSVEPATFELKNPNQNIKGSVI